MPTEDSDVTNPSSLPYPSQSLWQNDESVTQQGAIAETLTVRKQQGAQIPLESLV